MNYAGLVPVHFIDCDQLRIVHTVMIGYTGWHITISATLKSDTEVYNTSGLQIVRSSNIGRGLSDRSFDQRTLLI